MTNRRIGMTRTNTGFTLIELLVVIAIIAILAAILFPVFLSAKERGRQVKCVSNMRQLGLAFTEYVDDWHALPGGGPRMRSDASGTNPGGEWVISVSTASTRMDIVHGGLYKYTRNTQLYICPSDDHATKKLDFRNIFGLSYSMNNMLDRNSFGNQRVTMEMVKRPSGTVLLICEGHNSVSGVWIVDGFFGPGMDDPTFVHSGGTNVAFCDGHAKWAAYSTYSPPFNPATHNEGKLNFNPGSSY
jgi:prepilin-type N-terminal cleavage/methylation domain-containing protein/prepilin-type processing-associated H-X9-DG protein